MKWKSQDISHYCTAPSSKGVQHIAAQLCSSYDSGVGTVTTVFFNELKSSYLVSLSMFWLSWNFSPWAAV